MATRTRAVAWCDDHLFTIYRLAVQGLNNTSIAAALDVSTVTFTRWQRTKPLVAMAVERGRADATTVQQESTGFRSYVYQQLPEGLQDLWDELMATSDGGEFDYNRARALMEARGPRAQQSVLMHALCMNGYNMNQALQLAGVPHQTYKRWVANDPEFAELLDDVTFYKHNYYENALMGLVVRGEPSIVKYVAETQLGGRGYGSRKVQLDANIEHSGQVNHAHAHIDLSTLDLEPDVLRQVIDAIAKQKEANTPTVIEQRDADLPAGVVA